MNPLINLDHVWGKPIEADDWRAKLPESDESASDD